MTTVVTSASGFLGGAVVRELSARDREVWAVDLHRGPTLDGLDVEFDAGVRRMIPCSSVHAYDLETPTDLLSETSPRATAPGLAADDRSKAAGEAVLRKVADRGLDFLESAGRCAWAALRQSSLVHQRVSSRSGTQSAVSGKKALVELGHSPRPAEETVGDIYRWFKEHGDLD